MKLKPFHPLSQGLLMSFLLNENGGSRVYDASGNQNHGTGTNIEWGRDGLDLPGANEHIAVPNFIGQDDDWTIFVSFTQDTRNPNTQTDKSTLVSMMNGTGTGRSLLRIIDAGTPTYKLSSKVDGTIRDANTTIEVGTAYTAGLTQHGTSFHYYLNGVDDGSFVATADPANGDIVFFDNKNVTGDGCFDGTSGVVHWYNRPLSAAEMMWLDYDAFSMFEPDHISSITPSGVDVTIPVIIHHMRQQGIL